MCPDLGLPEIGFFVRNADPWCCIGNMAPAPAMIAVPVFGLYFQERRRSDRFAPA